MPELTLDQLTSLPPPESSPVSRIITRIKESIHRHTPEGRREEYREKWSHVLEGTKGLPRFELERRLSEEADKYARDRVVRDIVVAAVTTAGVGLGIGGIVALRNQSGIRELFQQYGAKVKTWTEQTIANAAAGITEFGLKGAAKIITDKPDLVTSLAQKATKQMLQGGENAVTTTDHIRKISNTAAKQVANGIATAAAGDSVKLKIAETAFDVTHAAATGAEGAVKTYASVAPNNALSSILTFFSNLLSGPKHT